MCRVKVTEVMEYLRSGPSNVRCDMKTGNGGWIVFQRRVDATVDFYRIWVDYKDGFGDLNGNFWMGLEKLHKLAAPGKGAKLRVDLRIANFSDGIKYAEYSTFEVSGESDGYKLIIGGYTGNAGDSLKYHNNMKFSTKDRDQDLSSYTNCALTGRGAWWYNACYNCNLNGRIQEHQKTISWTSSGASLGRLSFSEMKLKY